MTVRELIEELQKLDQEKDILIDQGYDIKKIETYIDCEDSENFYIIESHFY